jgi:hypothetical protein
MIQGPPRPSRTSALSPHSSQFRTFNIFTAILYIGGRSSIRNLRTRHAVVTGTHIHGLTPVLIQITAMILVINTHHHYKHQRLDPFILSVSRVTTALAKVSFVFSCSPSLWSVWITKGFSLVAFFACVKASCVCIHLSCLVCIQSVVHGVWSRLFCGHEGCSLTEVSNRDLRLRKHTPTDNRHVWKP